MLPGKENFHQQPVRFLLFLAEVDNLCQMSLKMNLSLSFLDHELLGQHAIFAEHTAISSATHPCPYIAYFGPVHPSSSSSNASVSEGSSFNNHWNGASVPSEIPTSYAFPGMDVHYHSWDHHSSPFTATSSRIGGAEQPSVPSVAQRAARTSSDIPRSGSFLHPFLVGHRSVFILVIYRIVGAF